MELKEYKAYLKNKLSQKRFTHSVNVSQAAVMLAKKYGGDVEKAEFAGLVHDICKEEPKEVQQKLMLESKRDVCQEEQDAPKVWHGIAGAEMLEHEFGVTDEDVLNAVRYHTVGRGGMSKLEVIVYLADMISAERDYTDVDVMRKKANESLEKAMLYALEFSMRKLLKKGAGIPHHTLDAYNEFLRKS